jgi:pyruvate/2-oxoglutarate dehydrogenase complex dihydrolipoamide dehydrogenase (E3) component
MATSGRAAELSFISPTGPVTESVECVLLSAGRTPNIESLNLDAVSVQTHAKGVVVNDFLQTTNRNIYAAGDVCSSYQFTHAADFMARAVIQNTLFFGRARASRLVIPWCTYTSPELAQVGLTEQNATSKGIAFDVWKQSLHDLDRAILDGTKNGFVKILTARGTDRIIGATIVGHHAGDLISEVTLAMTQRTGLRKLASTIHPYPTLADAIRKLGDQYNRTRLTPFVKRLFNTWLRWTR